MNSDLQLKVQAYLDNELTPGEARQIASLLTSDVEARDLYQELKKTKEILVQNEPVLRLRDSRDFYWSRIQREIDSAERISERRPSPWWLRLMAPVAGAVALFAILLSVVGPDRTVTRETASVAPRIEEPRGPLHQGEIMTSEMSAITFRSETEGVTVVWMTSDAEAQPAASLLDWFE
jgi:anti-sigma factor RsiW